MIKNYKEIRIHAMMRSGHHGIINWIIHHFDGYVIHFNDAMEFAKKRKINYEEFGIRSNIRDCYILNFEDIPIAESKELYKKYEKFLINGASDKIYNIFILRDPFNMFASRKKLSIKLQREYKNTNRIGKVGWIDDRAIEMWKEYAKRYLNPEENDIWINFNKWYSSEQYRMSISKKLDLSFIDAGLNIISNHGYGSSFEGQAYNNSAQFMPVLERYKNLLNDEEYLNSIKDIELYEIYEKIWGEIPKELIW